MRSICLVSVAQMVTKVIIIQKLRYICTILHHVNFFGHQWAYPSYFGIIFGNHGNTDTVVMLYMYQFTSMSISLANNGPLCLILAPFFGNHGNNDTVAMLCTSLPLWFPCWVSRRLAGLSSSSRRHSPAPPASPSSSVTIETIEYFNLRKRWITKEA